MSRFSAGWLIGVPLVILLGLAVTFSAPPLRDRDQHYELVRLVVDVLSEVEQNYVRELDPATRRKLVEDMVNGGLERLDQYSGFMNAQEFKQFERKSKGKFGGIGIQVVLDRVTGNLTVTTPIPGTPAFNAGILPGDQILKVDGQSLDVARYAEIVEMIQGDPGTPVTLTVLHPNESKPVDITMTRAIIEVETVLGMRRKADHPKDWDFIIDPEQKIAYVRIVEFDEPTAPTLKKLLEWLDAEGMRGLVLDVRGNPGGLLTSAVEVADLFLKDGQIVSTKGRRQNERVYSAKEAGTLFEPAEQRPIAVLIDRGSASASEIVAAALQDHGRAVIVGERSYGKGSVQNIFSMENQSTALKLTTQSYWRPSGKNIQRFPDSRDSDDWGVKPDPGFEVSLTNEERIAMLNSRRQRDAAKPGEEQALVDPVLDKALAYLRAKLK
jgi:carboxyl-terminal processing protease